jgi:hypothetical protein
VFAGEKQRRRVLTDEYQPADHENGLQCPICAVMIFVAFLVDFAHCEFWTNGSQANHDPKSQAFGYALETAVHAEPHIVDSHLVPREPQDAEEAKILGQCLLRIDLVHRGKIGEVRNEEQIVEQLQVCRLGMPMELRSVVKFVVVRHKLCGSA